MKNKMEIREDPKFLMTNFQGILTLNIRRPTPFDAGTYTCRAVNELGEALAECKLEVRGERGRARMRFAELTSVGPGGRTQGNHRLQRGPHTASASEGRGGGWGSGSH